MKFKTPILLSALTRGNFCHSQCNGLVNITDKGKQKEMCCIIFSKQLGIGENGAIRDKACLSAQRQAAKAAT